MAAYRLYLLDSAGRVRKAVVLECETDDEARRAAEAHRGPEMELWRLDRVVEKYPPLPTV